MKAFTHKQFAFLISAVFLGISLLLVLHHQIWMDEAYHYLLPRDSASLADLYRNASQGGHPILWNLLLFYYQKVLPGVLPSQLLHSTIACVCVFLINRYSPFKRTENVLITFGYFFLFEYNIIAKNYMLGICLIFVGLVLYTQKKPLLWIALVLALAGNVHLFSAFVAIALFIYILIKQKKQESRPNVLFACLILLVGIVLACIQVMPDPQNLSTYKNLDTEPFFSLDRIGKTLAFMCRGLINIPDFRRDSFWNSNIIFNLNRMTCYVFSALLVLIVFLQFKRDKLIVLLFFTPLFLIMASLYMAPISVGIRYWGYAYVMLIICMWLYLIEHKTESVSKGLFRVVILIQCLVSIPVIAIVLGRPFSNAKYADQSLKEAHLDMYPLFLQDLGSGPALSAYTNKKVYYPSSNKFASYSYEVNAKNISAGDFIAESVKDLKEMNADTCILVMWASLDSRLITENKEYSIKKISAHTGALINSEDYYLYLLSIY